MGIQQLALLRAVLPVYHACAPTRSRCQAWSHLVPVCHLKTGTMDSTAGEMTGAVDDVDVGDIIAQSTSDGDMLRKTQAVYSNTYAVLQHIDSG